MSFAWRLGDLRGGRLTSECSGALQHAAHVALVEPAGRRAVVGPTGADHRTDFAAEVLAAGHELPAIGGGERVDQPFLGKAHAVEVRVQLLGQRKFFGLTAGILGEREAPITARRQINKTHEPLAHLLKLRPAAGDLIGADFQQSRTTAEASH